MPPLLQIIVILDFRKNMIIFGLIDIPKRCLPFQICDEQKCQEEVSVLALNYMDRFLSIHEISRSHLQILAAACLLLASKLREPSCRALPAHLLVFYTDYSITKKDLIVSSPHLFPVLLHD